jgi:hypothetical protein
MVTSVSRTQVLGFRVRAQQLDPEALLPTVNRAPAPAREEEP